MTQKNYTDILIESYLKESKPLNEYDKRQSYTDAFDQGYYDEIPDGGFRDTFGCSKAEYFSRRSSSKAKEEPTQSTIKTPATIDYTDEKAAKNFGYGAKQNIIDYDSFHAAFDEPLKKAGCPDSIGGKSWDIADLYHIVNSDVVNLAGINTRYDYIGLNDKRTGNKIMLLDDKLASIRALRKLGALRFKVNADSLFVAKLERLYRKKQEAIDAFFKEVLIKIQEKVAEIAPKDELEKAAIKAINHEGAEFVLYRETYDEKYPHMVVRGHESGGGPFGGSSDGLAVKYPNYDGDIDKIIAGSADELASYFVDEFKKGNGADMSRRKKFPDEE